jgi:hypothetical protein
MTAQPRGIRNNNPGNIDRNATEWQGMADDQSTDPRFIVFKTPEYGIRALAKTLLAYQSLHGLNTIRAIINRWAPPVENNTASYISAVAADCGVKPDDKIKLDRVAIMKPLVNAIIAHECSGYAYPDPVIMAGLHLAGIVDAPAPPPVVVVAPPAPPKPLAKQASFVTKVGGVATAGAAACATYAPQVKGWADQLAGFTGAPIIAHAQTALLTVAGGLLMASIVFSVLKQKAATQ